MNSDKFSYTVEQMAVQDLNKELNKLGKNGWELVHLEKAGASYYQCVLKKREESKSHEDIIDMLWYMYEGVNDQLWNTSVKVKDELLKINEVIDQIYNKLES